MKDIQKTLKKKKQKKHVRQDKRTGKKHVREQKRTSKKHFKKRTSKKHVRQEKRTYKKRKHKLYGGDDTTEIISNIVKLINKIDKIDKIDINDNVSLDGSSNLIVKHNSGKPGDEMNEGLSDKSKNQCFWISFVHGLRKDRKSTRLNSSH